MRLGDEDVRGILARADEIQRHAQDGRALHSEMEAVIEAAGEVGIPRFAVERALRERLDLPAAPPAVGDLAFVGSTDGNFYVAEVTAEVEGGYRVRFLRGGERDVAMDELRPCSFLPGQRIVCSWPWWGKWTCTVVRYDAAQRIVTLSDGWGETHPFPISEVWLPSPRKPATGSKARIYATLIGAGATLGAIIGSVITAMILL